MNDWSSPTADPPRSIYRAEFLDDYRQRLREGDVLRLFPRWLEWAFRLLVLLAVTATLYGVFGQLDEYASGPGVLRLIGTDGGTRRPVVVAALPGQQFAELRPGSQLRVQFEGNSTPRREFVVTAVSNRVVGTEEARRALGQEPNDAGGIRGPAIIVEAALPSRGPAQTASNPAYFDGMQVRVQVRVGTQKVFAALVPGLRIPSRRSHG